MPCNYMMMCKRLHMIVDDSRQSINVENSHEIVAMMDDDAREQAHSDVSPCTELEFLKHYLEIAPNNLVIG